MTNKVLLAGVTVATAAAIEVQQSVDADTVDAANPSAAAVAFNNEAEADANSLQATFLGACGDLAKKTYTDLLAGKVSLNNLNCLADLGVKFVTNDDLTEGLDTMDAKCAAAFNRAGEALDACNIDLTGGDNDDESGDWINFGEQKWQDLASAFNNLMNQKNGKGEIFANYLIRTPLYEDKNGDLQTPITMYNNDIKDTSLGPRNLLGRGFTKIHIGSLKRPRVSINDDQTLLTKVSMEAGPGTKMTWDWDFDRMILFSTSKWRTWGWTTNTDRARTDFNRCKTSTIYDVKIPDGTSLEDMATDKCAISSIKTKMSDVEIDCASIYWKPVFRALGMGGQPLTSSSEKWFEAETVKQTKEANKALQTCDSSGSDDATQSPFDADFAKRVMAAYTDNGFTETANGELMAMASALKEFGVSIDTSGN